MTNFTVIWQIDIDAETPEQAAQEALKIQRDPNSAAVVFDIYGENYQLDRDDLIAVVDGEIE